MKVPPDRIQVFVQGKDVLMNRGMALRALVSLASLVIGSERRMFLAAGRSLVEFQLNAESPRFWNLVDHDAKLNMAVRIGLLICVFDRGILLDIEK